MSKEKKEHRSLNIKTKSYFPSQNTNFENKDQQTGILQQQLQEQDKNDQIKASKFKFEQSKLQLSKKSRKFSEDKENINILNTSILNTNVYKLSSSLINQIQQKLKLKFQDLKDEYFEILNRKKQIYKPNLESEKGFQKKIVEHWQKKPINLKQQELQKEAQKTIENLNNANQIEGELKLRREIKLKLNLLTAENFEIIKIKILEFLKEINGIEILVNLLVEKAQYEKKYASIYAQLCQFLNNQQILQEIDKETKQSRNKFKLILLQNIQQTFENSVDQQQQQQKAKILGNMNFIGELYITKVIQKKVINLINRIKFDSFINEYQMYILKKNDDFVNYEDHLEGLIILNNKIGSMIDDDKYQSNNEIEEIKKIQNFIIKKDKQFMNIESKYFGFQGLFQLFETIKDNLIIQSRFSCLLENLIEKRNNNWKESIYQEQGPQTLDQIYQTHKLVKQKPQPQKYIKKIEKKLRNQEIKELLKEQFKYLILGQKLVKHENQVESYVLEYDQEQFYKDILENIKKSSNTILLKEYFLYFYNDKLTNVQQRIFVFKRLYYDNIIKLDEFLAQFNQFLNKAFTLVCDFPFIYQILGQTYLEFVKDDLISFGQINYNLQQFEDQDDIDEYKSFFKVFIEQNQKLIKQNYDNKILTDLQLLTEKIN